MNNRRQAGADVSRPLNRKPKFDKKDDNNLGERKYSSRDGKFESRGDRTQKPNPRNRPDEGRFRSKGDRFETKKKFSPKGKNPKPWEKDRTPRIVSEMQITDGKHKGKYLKSSESSKVRPTARRIREVMFRILYRRVKAGRVLDLCAGGGTIGIEAISRGALIATFVERSAKLCNFIKTNLESLGIKEGHGEVFEIEAVPFLKQMEKRKREWDLVYYDPPYDANYEEVLSFFGRGVALKKRGVLVIEHPAEMFFPEKIGVVHRWRVLVQGESALSFYDRK